MKIKEVCLSYQSHEEQTGMPRTLCPYGLSAYTVSPYSYFYKTELHMFLYNWNE